MPNPKFNLDCRKFNEVLGRYALYHKNRTAPYIVNKKALYIVRGALRLTYRPTSSKIRQSLLSDARDAAAPIAALIINKQRGANQYPGLQGSAMKEAVDLLIKARISARAYLASGWVPAIKKLAEIVKSEKGGNVNESVYKFKYPKGDCIPAKGLSWNVIAKIINSSQSKVSTTDNPIIKIGEPALKEAIAKERESMLENIRDEMFKAAKINGINVK